jgi:DNA-directed RNA polymerase subunit RPC12/RpoP
MTAFCAKCGKRFKAVKGDAFVCKKCKRKGKT